MIPPASLACPTDSLSLNLEIRTGANVQVDDNLPAAKTIHQVVSANCNLAYALWDKQATLTPGKRLFTLMRVQQQPGEGIPGSPLQNGAIGHNHIPTIRIIFPTGVGMASTSLWLRRSSQFNHTLTSRFSPSNLVPSPPRAPTVRK